MGNYVIAGVELRDREPSNLGNYVIAGVGNYVIENPQTWGITVFMQICNADILGKPN
jgi:hypothetical protein